ELMDDLYYVHEMSDDNGMDELIAAIEELPASERVELQLPPDPTPADVAVQVRLQAPELLERRHAERFLTKKRSFEYYQPKDGADLTFRMPTKKQVAALEGALDDRLDQLKRGRNSKVFIYQKDDGVWFLVRHGQPCRREGTLNNDGPGAVYYRPEIYDPLRYDPTTGELSMRAETKKIGILYREKFGLHLFGDATMFPETTKYTLEPLISEGEDALVCSDVEGIDWVKLKEVEYHWGGPHRERKTHKADDLFALLRSQERKLTRGPLMRANFAVKFTDAKTPRTVTVRKGNVASFTRDHDAPLIEAWLVKRGFVTSEAPPALPTTVKTRVPHAEPARAVAHP
ncbi:MAG: hypothetical protein KC766_40010, partial [Myxococcales bacterium]|nr:hypothetical protein [Myxococcales bacterium]